jgi:hypothetical protein
MQDNVEKKSKNLERCKKMYESSGPDVGLK